MQILCIILSLIYINTFATTPEQLEILKKKSDIGDAEAQYQVAAWHSTDAIVMEQEKAFNLYKKAAEKGHAQAQFELGFCYLKGLGVEEDRLKAYAWFKKAAKQGIEEAQINLSYYYFHFDSVEAYAFTLLSDDSDKDARVARTNLESKLTSEQKLAGQKRSKELQKEIEFKLATKGDKK